MEGEVEPEQGIRRITAGILLGYILGVVGIGLGLLFMLVDLVGGLLTTAAGAWLFPPIRRRVIRWAGVSVSRGAVALVAVALLVAGIWMVVAAATAPSVEFQAFEEDVRAEGIDVEALAEEDRRWVLEFYISGSLGSEESFEELSTIGEVYAEHVPPAESGGRHQSLDVILLRQDGARLGSFSIRAEWARAYRDGEITRDSMLLQALARGTLEN